MLEEVCSDSGGFMIGVDGHRLVLLKLPSPV